MPEIYRSASLLNKSVDEAPCPSPWNARTSSWTPISRRNILDDAANCHAQYMFRASHLFTHSRPRPAAYSHRVRVTVIAAAARAPDTGAFTHISPSSWLTPSSMQPHSRSIECTPHKDICRPLCLSINQNNSTSIETGTLSFCNTTTKRLCVSFQHPSTPACKKRLSKTRGTFSGQTLRKITIRGRSGAVRNTVHD